MYKDRTNQPHQLSYSSVTNYQSNNQSYNNQFYSYQQKQKQLKPRTSIRVTNNLLNIPSNNPSQNISQNNMNSTNDLSFLRNTMGPKYLASYDYLKMQQKYDPSLRQTTNNFFDIKDKIKLNTNIDIKKTFKSNNQINPINTTYDQQQPNNRLEKIMDKYEKKNQTKQALKLLQQLKQLKKKQQQLKKQRKQQSKTSQQTINKQSNLQCSSPINFSKKNKVQYFTPTTQKKQISINHISPQHNNNNNNNNNNKSIYNVTNNNNNNYNNNNNNNNNNMNKKQQFLSSSISTSTLLQINNNNNNTLQRSRSKSPIGINKTTNINSNNNNNILCNSNISSSKYNNSNSNNNITSNNNNDNNNNNQFSKTYSNYLTVDKYESSYSSNNSNYNTSSQNNSRYSANSNNTNSNSSNSNNNNNNNNNTNTNNQKLLYNSKQSYSPIITKKTQYQSYSTHNNNNNNSMLNTTTSTLRQYSKSPNSKVNIPSSLFSSTSSQINKYSITTNTLVPPQIVTSSSSESTSNKLTKSKVLSTTSSKNNTNSLSSPTTTTPLKQAQTSFQKRKVTINDFMIGKNLGQGKFGIVYQAFDKKTKCIYALKKVPKSTIKSHWMIDQFILQVKLQAFLNHPNILGLIHTFSDLQHVYILLQYMQQGTLFLQLKKNQILSQKQAAIKLKQISSAIQYLHQNNIAHRDIKPQNIVMSHGVCKLCDFGWATICDERRKTYCGTFDYAAPEILEGTQYDFTVDLWCLGILAYEILVGKAPFYHISRKQTMKKIMNVQNQKINYPSTMSRDAKSFIQQLLRKNPEERLKSQDLLNHPFLKYAQK